jgi:hypothetical protein
MFGNDNPATPLRTERYSWWQHWSQLATYIFPRRYRWLVTPNQMNRGSPINGAIIDSHRDHRGARPRLRHDVGHHLPDPALVQAPHRRLRRGRGQSG